MTELTYPKDKLQIIVIDDASKDNTGKIADQYSKAHHFIKVVHRGEKEGWTWKGLSLKCWVKTCEW